MQQLLLRENVQSVKERQPMMQTNKILYGVSKRSSSRKPDSPAKTTRKACDKLNDTSTPPNWPEKIGTLMIGFA
jgi:hypothetical protein